MDGGLLSASNIHQVQMSFFSGKNGGNPSKKHLMLLWLCIKLKASIGIPHPLSMTILKIAGGSFGPSFLREGNVPSHGDIQETFGVMIQKILRLDRGSCELSMGPVALPILPGNLTNGYYTWCSPI